MRKRGCKFRGRVGGAYGRVEKDDKERKNNIIIIISKIIFKKNPD